MLREPISLLSLLPLLLTPLTVLVPRTTVPAQEVDLDRIDALLESGRTAWSIPGLAVAIVKDDVLVLAKGYGARATDGSEPVDAHTSFAVGSTTKAFTAAALGILVGEDRLSWDEPVASLLSGFDLHDAYASREITIRDLLAQRSGLPMANLMWLGGQHDRSELIRRIRHLEPTASFRSTFSYQNVIYTAAGQVIEAVTGTSWDTFLVQRLFRPLGMDRTNTSVGSLAGLDNVATPHAVIDGEPRPVPYRNIDAVGPAGSIHSTASDMGQWIRLQLGRGTFKGRRLIAESALAETHEPQILIRREGPLNAIYPEAHWLAYGMGWVVSDYRDRTLLDHSGGIDGMTSLVALVPEEGLGVAILTNLQVTVPPYWILYAIVDAYLGGEPTDWSSRFLQLADQLEARPEVRRIPETEPTLSLDRYEGTYENAPLGKSVVDLRDGSLYLCYGRLTGPLEHWHFDTFRVPWTDAAWLAAAGPGWVTFHLGRDGTVESLELETMPGETWELERIQHSGRVGAEGGIKPRPCEDRQPRAGARSSLSPSAG